MLLAPKGMNTWLLCGFAATECAPGGLEDVGTSWVTRFGVHDQCDRGGRIRIRRRPRLPCGIEDDAAAEDQIVPWAELESRRLTEVHGKHAQRRTVGGDPRNGSSRARAAIAIHFRNRFVEKARVGVPHGGFGAVGCVGICDSLEYRELSGALIHRNQGRKRRSVSSRRWARTCRFPR